MILFKNAVILSKGETTHVLLSKNLPEPQSKDLAGFPDRYGKYQDDSSPLSRLSLVAHAINDKVHRSSTSFRIRPIESSNRLGPSTAARGSLVSIYNHRRAFAQDDGLFRKNG